MRNWIRVSGLLLIVAGCGVAAMGQGKGQMATRPTSIHGMVRDAVTHRALDRALIMVDRSDSGFVTQVETDGMGKFTLNGLGAMIYSLRVKYPGYQEVTDRIDLTAAPFANVSYDLRPDPQTANIPPEGPGSTVSAVPDNAQQELTKGQQLLMQDHQPHDSIAHLQRAIELYPSYTSAYVLLGMALFQDGKPQDAHAALDKAMAVDPKSAAPYIMLGMLQNQERDFPGAEKSLTHGVELDPNAPEARYELAKACFAQGKWQDAEPHAQKAVAIMPAMAPAHVLLGNIALKKKDGAGAIREFKEYLKLDPQGPMAPGVTQMVQKLEQAAQSPQ